MTAKSASDLEKLETAILGLLPDDGTPVLNRIMRVMLARNLERASDEDTFFAARDALITRDAVGRMRGQGRQMFLTTPQKLDISEHKVPHPKDSWSEARLMEPLRAFLEGPFRKSLDLPETGVCIVQNTSVMGPQKEKWARPDFILVGGMRFKLLSGAQVDLHSFELKTETGGSVLAIHEALAQTRFTHFGHFVWHLPPGSKAEAKLDDIATHCDEHGIGLIRIMDPMRATHEDGYEVLVDPPRKPTLGSVVDGFLEARLSTEQEEQLMRAVRGIA